LSSDSAVLKGNVLQRGAGWISSRSSLVSAPYELVDILALLRELGGAPRRHLLLLPSSLKLEECWEHLVSWLPL